MVRGRSSLRNSGSHPEVPGKPTLRSPDHRSFDQHDELFTTVWDLATPSPGICLRRDAALALLLTDRGPSAELDGLLAPLKREEFYAQLVAFIRQRVTAR